MWLEDLEGGLEKSGIRCTLGENDRGGTSGHLVGDQGQRHISGIYVGVEFLVFDQVSDIDSQLRGFGQCLEERSHGDQWISLFPRRTKMDESAGMLDRSVFELGGDGGAPGLER